MEKKTLREISSSLRSLYQKALDAESKHNADYAISMLKDALVKEPSFVEAREKLRQFEKNKPTPGPFKKFLNAILTRKKFASGQIALARKKYADAMNTAEDLLAIDVTDQSALKMLAQAAEGCGLSFVAIDAMKTALEFAPEDPGVLRYLADLYTEDKQGVNALRIRQRLLSKNPEDLSLQQAVRAAAAMATMEENQWGENKSSREMLKDVEQAKLIEQKDRIARNIDDINELIGGYEKNLAQNGDSIEVCRKLAELYHKAGEYDKAVGMFTKVTELLGTLDPTIDRGIEKSNVAKFEKSIAEWRTYAEANPGKVKESEANIAKLTQECFDYRKGKALERVNNFPNDLQLRYDLALVYWEEQAIDEAIEQFQVAQKNPQRRLSTLVYLGRCFSVKGLYDIAIEQLKKAVSEMYSMDKNKLEAMYHLGLTYEKMGQPDSAYDYYKQIYQSDSKYLDVEERMQATKPK